MIVCTASQERSSNSADIFTVRQACSTSMAKTLKGRASREWRHNCHHFMIRTSAPRQSGDQFRSELHRAQVSPARLIGIVGEAAGPPTFRAGQSASDVAEADLDSSLFDLGINRFDPPGFIRAELSSIECRKCFRPGKLRHRSHENDHGMPPKSPKSSHRSDSKVGRCE